MILEVHLSLILSQNSVLILSYKDYLSMVFLHVPDKVYSQ